VVSIDRFDRPRKSFPKQHGLKVLRKTPSSGVKFVPMVVAMQGSKPSDSTTTQVHSERVFLQKSRRSPKRESGASVVEFAIISVFFFTTILGTIDFSMAMFEMNGVNFGTRSQARSASNGEWGTSLNCTLDQQGTIDPDLEDLMCSTKLRTRVASDRVRVRVRYEDPDFPTRPDVKPQKGKSLVLCTMTSIRSVSGVFGPLVKDKVITSLARSRIERDLSVEWKISGTEVSKGPLLTGMSSEKPFTGANWDFCEARPVGNTDVGTDTVAKSEETCSVKWTISGTPVGYVPGDEVDTYLLDGDVTNLSRDPWNDYEVLFHLPPGHTPVANPGEQGDVLGSPTPDVEGNMVWTFRKIQKAPPAQSAYGLPLDDGDLLPGNGVTVRVDIEATATSRLVPAGSTFFAEVRIPPAIPPSPPDPLNPFGSTDPIACLSS
jgi:TadE-like protein